MYLSASAVDIAPRARSEPVEKQYDFVASTGITPASSWGGATAGSPEDHRHGDEEEKNEEEEKEIGGMKY